MAVPPLFKMTQGTKTVYARDDVERERVLASGVFKANQKIDIGRFKGLGEMNAKQLKETAMDPAHRTMLRIELGDGDRSEIGRAVNALMGSKPEARFRFIQERAAFADQLDI